MHRSLGVRLSSGRSPWTVGRDDIGCEKRNEIRRILERKGIGTYEEDTPRSGRRKYGKAEKQAEGTKTRDDDDDDDKKTKKRKRRRRKEKAAAAESGDDSEEEEEEDQNNNYNAMYPNACETTTTTRGDV